MRKSGHRRVCVNEVLSPWNEDALTARDPAF